MSASPVLVADPDPLQRQLLDMLLDVDAFELEIVCDGSQALAHLRTHTPVAVILAADLGDIRGAVVCRKLKSVRRLAHVPVVLVADEPDDEAGLSERLKREAREAGVDLLLQKPLGDKNLRERVQRLIQEPPLVRHDRSLHSTAVFDEIGGDDASGTSDYVAMGMASELGGLRAEVARLRQENDSLKARLTKVKERAKALQAEVEELKKPRGLFGRRG